jgi:hypothetical protein
MAVVQDLKAVLQVEDKNFQSRLKNAEKDTNKFTSSMKKMGLAIAAAFTVNALKNFAVESASLANNQIQAENKLLVALKGREDSQRRLIKQAQELQAITLFGDEVTIEAQAVMAALGMTEDQITKLMPKIQDMATALNMDLVSAASLVAKSVTGPTNALQRYGITIDSAGTASQKAGALLDQLTTKFDGQAEAAAKVALGPLTQLKNIYGDLKEEVGKTIINAMSPFVEVLKDSLVPNSALLKQYQTLQKQIPKTSEEIRKYARDLGITETAALDLVDAQQKLLDMRVEKTLREVKKEVATLEKEYNALNKQYIENIALVERISAKNVKTEKDYAALALGAALLEDQTKRLNDQKQELAGNLILLSDRGQQLTESQKSLIKSIEDERKALDELAAKKAEEDAKEAARLAALDEAIKKKLADAEATAKQYEELSKLSRLSEVQFQFRIQEEAFTKFEELTKNAAIDYDQLANSIIDSSYSINEALDLTHNSEMQRQREAVADYKAHADQMQAISEQIGMMGIQAISGLADAFGQAVAGGQDFGASILSIFGGFMKQLGQLMITTSIMAKKFQAQLFTPGPGAIAAGIALVALGSAFSSKASKMTQSMGSGGGGGSASTSMGGRGMSTDVTRLAGPPVNIEGEFQIRGRDLVMVLEKTNYSNTKTRG